MSLRRAVPMLAFLAALAAPLRAPAQQPPEQPWTVELSPGFAYLNGNTKYRIADSDGASSIASELDFPIEVGGLALHARVARARAPGRGAPAFELGGFFSLHQGRGTLKDSDWLSGPAEIAEVGTAHDGKDIYSESRVWLHAYAVDARAAWEVDALAPGFVLAPMLGVFYERLDYEVGDGQQWGYGSWDTPKYTGSWSGRALDYRVSYLVPYVGGRAAVARDAFRGRAELWYSPVAGADDRDDHLFRQKVSTTNASGSAWSASVSAGIALGARDTIQAQASIVRIRAEGTQVQRFYDGSDLVLRIPSTITSSRTAIAVTYSHAL
jgi:outer membrane protease